MTQPNLIPQAQSFAGSGWWDAPHARNQITSAVPAQQAGYAVREHRLRRDTAHADSAIQGFYIDQGLVPGELYCASMWVWLPADFAGSEVGAVFMGYPSVTIVNANLAQTECWQRIWITARLPPAALDASPNLRVVGPADARIYSTNWRLEQGPAPCEAVAEPAEIPAPLPQPKPASAAAQSPGRSFRARLGGLLRGLVAERERPKSPEKWALPRYAAARPRPHGEFKWYFAANRAALLHSFDQIQVAVLSARKNTKLRPVCLVDETEGMSDALKQLNWLEQKNVQLVLHNAKLFEIVRAHFGAAADPYSGHWLRCDIPVIEHQETYVLYTDIDVMFRQPIDLTPFTPEHFACTPEHDQNDFSYFNSGVMVMNLPSLANSRGKLIETLRARLPNMAELHDQNTLNEAYRNEWAKLPALYNWKPYWGFNAHANIVHFHGPKPAGARRMLHGELDLLGDEMRTIFSRCPAGYAAYLAEFDQYLASDPHRIG